MQVLAILVEQHCVLPPVVNRASRRWLHERIRIRLASVLSAFQGDDSVRRLGAGPIRVFEPLIIR
jgi:hypothetical protein